ncbi:hypothetical protein, partial [Pseudomonas sp. PNPG3]|uniref:hypothetical protein n=1 Tax=Pseudomonas sp. PNPG3 TaxID=2919497 RepID=UPI001FFC39FD
SGRGPLRQECRALNCTGTALRLAHAPAQDGAELELDPGAIRAWLAAHPEALLVDVRGAREAGAGPAMLHGSALPNVPLARLAEHAS